MAHFYGSMKGSRGETTRMGTTNSGMTAHVRGWNLGVRVYLTHNGMTGKDEVSVYRTSGSGQRGSDTLLAHYVQGDDDE